MSTRINSTSENLVEHKNWVSHGFNATENLHNSKSSAQQIKPHSISKPFKCSQCPYRAKTKGMVNSHLKNIHLPQSRPFPCAHPGCNYKAKKSSTLKRHLQTHSDEKSLFCTQADCNFSTNHKQNLHRHTQIHTGEKPFACQFESCSYATKTFDELLIHSRTHTKERPFKCPEANCEYSAASNAALSQHQLTHSPNEGEERPSFSCPLCEYKGKSKKHLYNHIKSHTLEKLFKCDEPNCNHEAKSKTEIKNHKRVHSDEKPFSCSVESCEYRCKTKKYLLAHLKAHSEERPYKCELCPFRGKTKGVVTTHIKTIHLELRPFKCTDSKCDYASKRKGDLQKHLLIHKGEKSYSCSFPDCNYRAVFKDTVKSHEGNFHNSEKKEKCRICDFSCKVKSSLTRHMRTHTKETPYNCKEPQCEYRSKCSENLTRHKKQIH